MKNNYNRFIFLTVCSLFSVLLGFSSYAQTATNTFTSNGTWTVPVGVSSIQVFSWGGGGAGGGATYNAGDLRIGGGGGGGDYATATLTVTPGDVLTINVGAGGVGSLTGEGTDGAPSYITGFEFTLFAQGGQVGVRNSSGGTPSGGIGGYIPITPSSAGLVVTAGSDGSAGTTTNTLSNFVTTFAGAGGAGGNGGAGGLPVGPGSLNGAPGLFPGGGGSGGRNENLSGASFAGGNGADGQIIISYDCPAVAVGFSFNGVLAGTGFELEVCYDEEVEITLTEVWGGGPSFDIEWEVFVDGSSIADATLSGNGNFELNDALFSSQILPAGTYVINIVSIVDEGGCEFLGDYANYTATVIVRPEPVVGFSFNGVLTGTDDVFEYCYNDDVEVTLSHVVAGTEPFDIEWTVNGVPGIATNVFSAGVLFSGIQAPGTYTITITSIVDDKDCEVSDVSPYRAFVIVHPEPVVGFSFNGDLADTDDVFEYCYNDDVEVTLSHVVSGTEPFDIEWTVNGVPGVATNVFSAGVLFSGIQAPGTYTITITSIVDANSCSPASYAPYTAVVIVHPEPAVGFSFNDELADTGDVFDICFEETLTVTLSHVWVGTAPFDIEWTVNDVPGIATNVFSAGVLFSGIQAPGTYVVQITSIVDANGCSPADYAPYTATVRVFSELVWDNLVAIDLEAPPTACSKLHELPVITASNNFQSGIIGSYTLDNVAAYQPSSFSNPQLFYFPVGVTVFTYEATNFCHTIVGTLTVTVEDVTPPNFTACPGDIVLPNTPDQCGSVVTWDTPTADDNCTLPPNAIVRTSPIPNGGFFPVGVHEVTYVVTDASGLTNTCTFTVTINDVQDPVIACIADLEKLTDEDLCTYTAVAGDFDPTSYGDNCGQVTLTWTLEDGNGIRTGSNTLANVEFILGVTTVTWTVTDAANNPASCSFEVLVKDEQKPVLVLQDFTAELDATGNITVTLADLFVSASDNCTALIDLAFDPVTWTFTCSDVEVGDHIVTVTVTDLAGNFNTATATITVEDNVPPTVLCRANNSTALNVSADENCEWTVLDVNTNNNIHEYWGLRMTNDPPFDACGIASYVYSFVSGPTTQIDGDNTNMRGQVFQLGETVVRWTVTDVNGNSNFCEFTMTVLDTTKPTFACVEDQVKLTDSPVYPENYVGNPYPGDCFYTAQADEFDPYDIVENCGIYTATYELFNGEALIGTGSNTLAGVQFPTGINTVVWTVTDASGNNDTCTFTVTVNDEEEPVIICPPDIIINLTTTGCVTSDVQWAKPQAIDNCDGVFNMPDIPVNYIFAYPLLDSGIGEADNSAYPSGKINNGAFPVGVTTLTYFATDVAGNTGYCSFTVTVHSLAPPFAGPVGTVTVTLDPDGEGLLTVQEANQNSSIGCLYPDSPLFEDIHNFITLSRYEFDCDDVGIEITETLYVTDKSGRVASETFTVVVLDVTPPEITPIATVYEAALTAGGIASVTWDVLVVGDPYDACGVETDTFAVEPFEFDCSDVGAPFTVTISVDDIHGNTGYAEVWVQVVDNLPPVVNVLAAVDVPLDEFGIASITYEDVVVLPLLDNYYDNCGIASYTLEPSDFTCQDVGDPITYTLTVWDVNGNPTVKQGLLTVKDLVKPDVYVKENIVILLDEDGYAQITPDYLMEQAPFDACGILTSTIDLDEFFCADVGPHTITLTVEDNNENKTVVEVPVLVKDEIKPEISGPTGITTATLSTSCEREVSWPKATATDNCDVASFTVYAESEHGDIILITQVVDPNTSELLHVGIFPVGVSTVTYTAVDPSLNKETHVFTVTVNDIWKPVVAIADSYEVVDCPDEVLPYAQVIIPTANDNCDGTITGVYDGHEGELGTCAGIITYTWSYTDKSDNTSYWRKTYEVIRTTLPSEVDGPVATAATVACLVGVVTPTLPVVEDACGEILDYDEERSGVTYMWEVEDCVGIITYTYVYIDCADLEFTWEFVYTVTRTVAPAEVGVPVATAKTVECLADVVAPTDPDAPVLPNVETFDNFTHTGTSYGDGSFVGVNNVTWYYTHVTREQAFEIDGIGMLLRRLSDNSKIVSEPISGGIGNFSVELRKAFTGTGNRQAELFVNGVSKGTSILFGSASGADATVHLFAVNDINIPGDMTIEIRNIAGGQFTIDNITWTPYSDEPLDAPLLPVVADVCGTILTAPQPIIDDSAFDGCEGTIIYTYVYEDCAGLEFIWDYTYTIERSTPPAVVTSVATLSTVECIADAVAPELPVVEDVCGNVLTAAAPVMGGTYETCEGTRIYTYTFTDCAGLALDWVYTYTIERSTPPAEVDGPVTSTLSVECESDAVPPVPLPVVEDVCGNVLSPVGAPVVQDSHDPVTNVLTERAYTYLYEDCANLTFTWSFTYYINDDEAPVFTFEPGNVEVFADAETCDYTHSEDENIAAKTNGSWNAEADDNCGVETLVYTLEGATEGDGTDLDGVTFKLGVTTVTWTATDYSGNKNTHSYTVTVRPEELAGTVHYYRWPTHYPGGNTPMAGVMVRLIDVNGQVIGAEQITNGDGEFLFDNVDDLKDARFIEVETDKPHGRITTTDVLAIQRRAVNFPVSYWYPEDFIDTVGDVDGESGVEGFDALEVLFRILHNINPVLYPATSYNFVSDWTFYTPVSTTEGIVFSNTDLNIARIPFSGDRCDLEILVRGTGDVYGDYNQTLAKSSIPFQNEEIQRVTQGDIFELPVVAEQSAELGAMTIMFDYASDKLEILDVVSDLDGIRYSITDDQVAVVWTNLSPVSFNEKQPVITLVARAIAPVAASDLMFTLDAMTEFADGEANVLPAFDIAVNSISTSNETVGIIDTESSYLSVNAFPNPFREELTVSYSLTEAAKVRITLINALGAEISTLVEENAEAGQHSINFHAKNYSLDYGAYFIRYDVNSASGKHSSRYVKLIYVR